MENKKGFAMNHHNVALDPMLTFREYWLYGVLQFFRNGKTGRCYPSYNKIISCSHMKIKRTAIYESVLRLEKAGYLTVIRKNGKVSFFVFPLLSQPNRYSVLVTSSEQPPPICQNEGGHSFQRTPPLRSSAYKQEVENKNFYEQDSDYEENESEENHDNKGIESLRETISRLRKERKI
jgi:hypothetical protein